MTTQQINPVNTLLVLLLAALFTSCNEDKMDMDSVNQVSTEEAVAVIESALVSGSGGVTGSWEEVILVANEYSEKSSGNPCGETFDSTYNKDFGGNRFSASYSTAWNWMVNCSGGIVPTSLDVARTATGSYTGPVLSATDQVDETWIVDNLVAGGDWTIAGMHVRSGDYQTKNDRIQDFTADVDVDITEVTVSKSSFKVISGSGGVSATLEGANGEQITWEGSLEFKGNGQVVLILNGEEYVFDMNG